MSGSRPRIGVLGGTFDPPHVAHLVVALDVRHALALDRVVLMVAGEPWQKRGTRPITPAPERLALVQAAVHGIDGVEAGDLEVRRPGPSYTADTLEELASSDPRPELYVIVGSDAAVLLPTWHRVDLVRDLATLVVVHRPGAEGTVPAGFRVVPVPTPDLDVSSTDLRRRVAEGRPIDGLLPARVASRIRSRHLYAVGR